MAAHRVLAAGGKARGGGDADPSATTSNAAYGRNDPVPSGFGRRGAVCFVAAPRRWIRIASSRRLAYGPTASRTRPLIFPGQAPSPSILLGRLECVLDLLLDALVVLVEQRVLLFREDPEGDANHAVREFHVQPVLPVRDPARYLKVEPAEAGLVVGERDLVPRIRARVDVAEESDAAGVGRVR